LPAGLLAYKYGLQNHHAKNISSCLQPGMRKVWIIPLFIPNNGKHPVN
jgi:hypothetical protein